MCYIICDDIESFQLKWDIANMAFGQFFLQIGENEDIFLPVPNFSGTTKTSGWTSVSGPHEMSAGEART